MKTSEQGLQLIIEREGKRNAAYLDSVGVPTIGVGHTGPEVHMGLTWTDEQVMDALRADMAWTEAAVNRVAVPLEQFEFDALASFTFNVGQGAFATSTLKRMLDEDEPRGVVALQFDRWHIPPEITPRRNAEKAQFLGAQFSARIE
jgi:lysozyme